MYFMKPLHVYRPIKQIILVLEKNISKLLLHLENRILSVIGTNIRNFY